MLWARNKTWDEKKPGEQVTFKVFWAADTYLESLWIDGEHAYGDKLSNVFFIF